MSYGYGVGYGYGGGFGFGGGYYSSASSQISAIRGQQAVAQTSNSVSIYNTSKNGDIKEKILNFADELERGHEDKAMAFYNELVESLGGYAEYSEANRAYIASLMEATIASEKGGENFDLAEFIRNHAVSTEQRDMQEFQYNGIFGSTHVDKNTKETMQNIILGKKENTEYNGTGNFFKKAGIVVAGPALGAAAGLIAVKTVATGAKIGAITGGPAGAIIGAAIGAGVAIIGGLLFKAFAPTEV